MMTRPLARMRARCGRWPGPAARLDGSHRSRKTGYSLLAMSISLGNARLFRLILTLCLAVTAAGWAESHKYSQFTNETKTPHVAWRETTRNTTKAHDGGILWANQQNNRKRKALKPSPAN